VGHDTDWVGEGEYSCLLLLGRCQTLEFVTATQPLPSRVYSDQENDFVDPWYQDLPRDVSIRIPAGEKTDVFTITFPPVPGASFP
jgi:hypothetical protein